jgi:hypothetical protein
MSGIELALYPELSIRNKLAVSIPLDQMSLHGAEWAGTMAPSSIHTYSGMSFAWLCARKLTLAPHLFLPAPVNWSNVL